MSSLATIFKYRASVLLASCQADAVKLSSPAASELNLNYIPLILFISLLSLACYFSFTVVNSAFKVMNDLFKEPSAFGFEPENDQEPIEIEMVSIDSVIQRKSAKSHDAMVVDTEVPVVSTSVDALITQKPLKMIQRSRRNSIKSRSKRPGDIGYVNLTFTLTGPDDNIVVPPNHERITLVDDTEDEEKPEQQDDGNEPQKLEQKDDGNDLREPEQKEKKPFEYYLRWDLPMDELDELTYAEKYRRFYLLNTFGESKKEPEKTIEAVQAENIHQPHPLELVKPMNLISDLVHQANQIDIPKFQVHLLKLNHQLTQSYLKRLELRKFDASPSIILRGLFEFPRRYQLRQPAINLDAVIKLTPIRVDSNAKRNEKCHRGSFSLNTNRYHQLDLNIFNPKLHLKQ